MFLDDAALTDHARRLVETCWRLGGLPGLQDLKLRRWAHMLGFRGHFATKSRGYSVTFGGLRKARAAFHALLQRASLVLTAEAASVLVVNDWRYAGRGAVVTVDWSSLTETGGLPPGPDLGGAGGSP